MRSNNLHRPGQQSRGVVVPMITPFTLDGDLDEMSVRRVIDHLLQGGVQGIFLLGTTGEAASIPYAMRSRLVTIAVDHIENRALVYAGIGDNCLTHSLEAAEAYARLGVDIVVAHLPGYYPLTRWEQLAYYTALAERIPVPLMLYNIPATTHMSIPIDTIEALSHHPKIIGLKDSENDPRRLETVMRRLGGRSDFSVLVGAAVLSAKGLAMGADGFVPSAGNLVPELCQRLYQKALAGEWTTVERLQQRMDRIAKAYQEGRPLGQTLAALKAAMHTKGLCSPAVLPPLRPLDTEQQTQVQRALAAFEQDDISL